MNNMYGTPAGGYDSQPAGGNDTSATTAAALDRKKRRLRWGAGITLASFLAGGGIALAAVTSGGTAAAGSASTTGAELNSVLSTAASSSTASTPAKVRWALGRLRRLGGVDGTVTFHNKKGFHELSFERGTISSVSSSDVVIKAADGTTWTWQIVSDTVVRKDGSKTTASALSAGEKVFAGGPVVNGAKDARLIVIGKTKPTASPSPTGSSSAQTSLR
ncbi:MAG: hypothetical protein WAK82_39990 [Streptosporangiaceae bacterium]